MSNIKVGYQGVPGSYSEEALLQYFSEDVSVKQYELFEDVFQGLMEGEIRYGVLPIENSSTGAISEVYDLLNRYDNYIVGETFVKPAHNLLGMKGAKIEEIVQVYSHTQGFEQCKAFLDQFSFLQIPYYNTARSAEYVSQLGNPTIAAIASKKAGMLYDLEVLAENINSNKTNTTRFIIIGNLLEVNPSCNKISTVLSTKHQAGALYKTLENFARNQINLLKIESRPVQHTPWEYYFYIDFEGNVKDLNIIKAVDQIMNDSSHFKLLGNYKKQIG